MRIMGATGVDYRRWRPSTASYPSPLAPPKGVNVDETSRMKKEFRLLWKFRWTLLIKILENSVQLIDIMVFGK